MKNILIPAVISLFVAGLAFAAPESYSVKSVTGKVQYESTPGNWKNVSEGQKLSSSTVINTSLNSSLVLSNGSTDVTIKAMQKGTIQSLTTTTTASTGLKKNKGLNKTTIAGASESSSKGVATASSRASEAKEDLDWDE